MKQPVVVRNQPKAVSDERLIRREYYNPNKFSVTFTLMLESVEYITRSGITIGRARITLPPEGFTVLNHAFYVIRAADAGVELFELVTNYGDQIGIGNKLPSRPDVKVRQF